MTPPEFVVLLAVVFIVLPALPVCITWVGAEWTRRHVLCPPNLSGAALRRGGTIPNKKLPSVLRGLALAEIVAWIGGCLAFGFIAGALCHVFLLGPDTTWKEISDAAGGWTFVALFAGMIFLNIPVVVLANSVTELGEWPHDWSPDVGDTVIEYAWASAIAAITANGGVALELAWAVVVAAIGTGAFGGLTFPTAWLCFSIANLKLAGLCGQLGAACDSPSLEDAAARARRSWRTCSLTTGLLYVGTVTLAARSGEWWFFPALLAPLLGFIGYATCQMVIVLRRAANVLQNVIDSQPARQR